MLHLNFVLSMQRHLRPLFVAAMCIASPILANAEETPGRTEPVVQDVYEVRNVAIDVTARTAASARDIGIRRAQRQALELLIERLTAEDGRSAIPVLDDAGVDSLVLSIQFANERYSSTRYIADLTITFNEDAIRQLLAISGAPFSETLTRPVLVVPTYQSSGLHGIWMDPDHWTELWRSVDWRTSLVPFVFPEPVVEEPEVSEENLAEDDSPSIYDETIYEPQGEFWDEPEPALSEDPVTSQGDVLPPTEDMTNSPTEDVVLVGADDWTMLEAEPTLSFEEQYASSEQLTVTAYDALDLFSGSTVLAVNAVRQGVLGEDETQYRFQPGPGEDFDAFMTRVAQTIGFDIANAWKQQTLVTLNNSQQMAARVQLGSLADWVTLRTRLNEVPLIRNMTLETINTAEATFTLDYFGTPEQLSASLKQYGIGMDRGEQGWSLYFN